MASRRLRVFVTVNDTAAKDVVTVDSSVECSQWSSTYDYSFRFVDNTTKIVKQGIPVKLTVRIAIYKRVSDSIVLNYTSLHRFHLLLYEYDEFR